MINWILAVFEAAGDAMTFRDGASHVPSLSIAFGIAFLAGASTLLGHGAVLYINRIKGLRGAAALALSGTFLVLLYVVHAMVLYLVAPLITGASLPLKTVVAITLTSTAPMIFGIFEFVPVLGLFLGKILNAWSFVALWVLILTAYDTTPVKALLVGGIAWLVMQLLSKLAGPTISRMTGRLWQIVTGVPTQITARDILSGTPIIPVSLPGAAEEGVR